MSGPEDPWAARLGDAWRTWGAGVAIAVLGALATFALARLTGSYGWFLVLGAPAAVGFAIGYSLRFRRGARSVVVLLVVLAVIGGLVWSDLGGVVCGVIFLVIAAVPALVGAVVGSALRQELDPERNPFLPLLLFLAVGGGLQMERLLAPQLEPESVVTRRTLDLPSAEAWDRLVFYEEVPLPPPLLARLGIPHPLRTEGRVTRPGDVKLCVYSTGHLRKRITGYRPGRLLAFDVIEQRGVEDRSAELLSGSFRFEPLADGRTRVTLTTTYRPLLQARGVWRPFEVAVARVLHNHVLDGMELAVVEERGLRADAGAP